MAGMRKDAHQTDFEPIAGFDYWAFWYARARVLDVHEPNLEPWDRIGLGLADYPEWTYCREWGAVGPEAVFLQVDLERRDGRRRVCDRCADRKAEYDGSRAIRRRTLPWHVTGERCKTVASGI